MDKVARNLGAVHRWSIIHTIRRQTVAEHNFQVARNALIIWDEIIMPLARQVGVDYKIKIIKDDMIYYALRHDDSESITGDIPAPAKRKGYLVETSPSYVYKADPLSKLIIKVADNADAYCFLLEELSMGNKLMRGIANGVREALEDACNRLEIFMDEEYGIEVDKPIKEEVYKYIYNSVDEKKYYIGDLK